MRVRTGLTPDAWRDEGPQQGRMIPMAYSSVHALNVGQMAPVVSGKMLMTVNEAARNRRRSAVAKAARAAEYPRRVSDFGDDSTGRNPDNGAVEASITEVHL